MKTVQENYDLPYVTKWEIAKFRIKRFFWKLKKTFTIEDLEDLYLSKFPEDDLFSRR